MAYLKEPMSAKARMQIKELMNLTSYRTRIKGISDILEGTLTRGRLVKVI